MNPHTFLQSGLGYRLNRRKLLSASLAMGIGGWLLRNGTPTARAASLDDPHHLMWVWQFSADGQPQDIGAKLLQHNLGIILKTHDGVQWMSDYDKSPFAISGAAQTETLANYYEGAGVPFHAWAVVSGDDPIQEARMAADVLSAGARSIYLDVESSSGFWHGTPADAVTFGNELRRLQPNGRVVLSIDSRPWILTRLPLQQFASFSDAVAPQQYWRTFNTQANWDRYNQSGFPVAQNGVTPEFLLSVSNSVLGPLGLPVIQVGQGATPDSEEWRGFINGAYSAGANYVTIWRYGVTTDDVIAVLDQLPPILPPPPLVSAPGAAGGVYVVQAGDTLGGIAAAYGISVDDLMQLNGLSDPNYIYEGQQLQVPGAAGTAAAVPVSQPTDGGDDTAAGQTYTVQSGDTLYGIAARYGTTSDAIVQLNGLADPNYLSIGQELRVS